MIHSCRSLTPAVVLVTMLAGAALLAAPQVQDPPYPEFANGPQAGQVRGFQAIDKLAMELRTLYRQYSSVRGGRREVEGFSEREIEERFGTGAKQQNPSIEIAIRVAPNANLSAIQRAGAAVRFQVGDLAYATAPVLRLEQIARQPAVVSIVPVTMSRIPEPPETQQPPAILRGNPARGGKLLNEFDRQGLTGKGVIVAIIDSGIDWRHPDFIKPDGTSRILYLWDLYDDSWESSGGKTGTKPPANDTENGKPLGTLYTNAQINAALKGNGVVNSRDEVGHGTACAGVAAGNGRATANGVPAGTYKGVAPEADLIVVNIAMPDENGRRDSGQMNGLYGVLGARWVMAEVKALKKPCVVNMSYGRQYSAHDGTEPDEVALDDIIGPGKPGSVICVAAGNEGRDNFYAGGVFGPRRPGQRDIESLPIELFVQRPTLLTAYFDHKDDWGLAVTGLDKFFVKEDGTPVHALFTLDGGKLVIHLSETPKVPANVQDYLDTSTDAEAPMQANPKTDRLVLKLEPGQYLIRGFSKSEKVVSGRFSAYLPATWAASFGKGAQARYMIGSPGNATYVLTVGSYDFRGAWENQNGEWTAYNLTPGELSFYTSPGYRRDGFVKPDITAPARYAISTLAKESKMATAGDYYITHDGFHIAWQGTSAASPYVAGVIALMLQKNPTLDAAKVKEIVMRTATHDGFTGKVPNPEWGYGKINPAVALRATPVKAKTRRQGAAR